MEAVQLSDLQVLLERLESKAFLDQRVHLGPVERRERKATVDLKALKVTSLFCTPHGSFTGNIAGNVSGRTITRCKACVL